MTDRGSRRTLPPPPSLDWRLQDSPDPDIVAALMAALHLPRPLCQILAVRGIVEVDEAKRYLRPLLDHLHPAEQLTDALKASNRIFQAIESGERILVHGDYDVDGIAGTALLTRWLRRLGGDVVPFVPHRLKHGYDFGSAGIRAALEAGAKLVVTVDCGIVAHEAVADAVAQGLQVIVTDHHTPGATLPPALAVLNPAREDCAYPFAELCGTGVAFKLCQLMADQRGIKTEELHDLLALVAMATVADLVPMRGENRTLVRFGLRALAQTAMPGLAALLERTKLQGTTLDAGKIGFVLAPRINAQGRMGDAGEALRLLLTDDPVEAGRLADQLEEINRTRQEADRATLEQALDTLSQSYDPEKDFGVVIAGEGWHPGVIGIVASRVVERIHRPTILVALDGDSGRGSARSVPSFHLYDAIEACSSLLTRFGGHRQAAGMDLPRAALEEFRAAFNNEARKRMQGTAPRPTLRGDLEVGLDALSDELEHFLQYLGPFGMGNTRPVFFSHGVRLSGSARQVGKGHLKFHLAGADRKIEAIGFHMFGRVPIATLDRGPVDIAYQLTINEFRGKRTLQARLKDVRPHQGAQS